MDNKLGHRERCQAVKTGRQELCDCGYANEKLVVARWKERWNTSYWYPGSPIFEAAQKIGKEVLLKFWKEAPLKVNQDLLITDAMIDPSLEWWFK